MKTQTNKRNIRFCNTCMKSTKEILTTSLKTKEEYWKKNSKIFLKTMIWMMKTYLKMKGCRLLGTLILKRTPFQLEDRVKMIFLMKKMMKPTCKT